jgi:hypothetical protein
MLALVDPQGRVIGTYDGLNANEVDQLLVRLADLLAAPDLSAR